jgi:hypothetical protein
VSTDQTQPEEEAANAAALPPAEDLFLSPDAVPRRKNQMLAAGLALVAVIVLAVVVTLMLLIHYDSLASLFSPLA